MTNDQIRTILNDAGVYTTNDVLDDTRFIVNMNGVLYHRDGKGGTRKFSDSWLFSVLDDDKISQMHAVERKSNKMPETMFGEVFHVLKIFSVRVEELNFGVRKHRLRFQVAEYDVLYFTSEEDAILYGISQARD